MRSLCILCIHIITFKVYSQYTFRNINIISFSTIFPDINTSSIFLLTVSNQFSLVPINELDILDFLDYILIFTLDFNHIVDYILDCVLLNPAILLTISLTISLTIFLTISMTISLTIYLTKWLWHDKNWLHAFLYAWLCRNILMPSCSIVSV